MGSQNIRSLTRSIALQRIDLAALIHDIRHSYQEVVDEQSIQFEIDVPNNLWVDLDPILMRDAFRKVIDNAIDAMPEGGCITITSLVGRFGLEIEIADGGTGLSEEVAERVFEPYVTTHKDRAGLGLSLVREIACVHQASVTMMDCPDGGAALTFLFPFRNAAKHAA